MDNQVLEFRSQRGEALGRATMVDGTLEGNTPMVKNLIASVRENGLSDAEIVSKFDGYGNQLFRANLVSE